jgi:hypothetical protein
MTLPPLLRYALEACKAVQATADGELCYRWISQEYKDRGVTQHHLRELAKRGVLSKTDQNKRGVYYRLNPGW